MKDQMPSNGEIIEKLARENERLILKNETLQSEIAELKARVIELETALDAANKPE